MSPVKSNKFNAAFGVGLGVTVGVGEIVGVIVGVGDSVGVGVLPLVTVVVAAAVLLPGTGSPVWANTATLLVMTVPFTVLALTFTVRVSNIEPLMNDGFVQLIAPVAPTAGVVQLKPNLAAGDNDTKVVFAGTAVDNTVLTAKLGPLLFRNIEYRMFPPAATGSGVSVIDTAKSAFGVGFGVGVGVGVIVGFGVIVGVGFGTPITVVEVVDELLPATGSVDDDEIDALLVITVPFGVFALTLTVSTISTVPLINVGVVQLIAPVPPTAGVVQVNVNFEVCASDTNVVLAGTFVVNFTPVAKSGPAFVTAIG